LIVDVRLGAYNGLQLAHLVRPRRPDVVVIAMSGYEDSVLRREAEQAGAVFLLKPFDADVLYEALSRTQP
jgi:FixJ family two-component response regulator